MNEPNMDADTFEVLVSEAIEELPDEFRTKLDNVDILIKDWPDRRQIAGLRNRFELLGLYEGIPHIERGERYNMALPDTITLFRRPILARCRSREEARQAVRDTLRHEIAHHFGSSDHTLSQIERRWRRRRP